MANTVKIPGELESVATGNKVVDIANVKDKTKGNKSQFQINAEHEAALSDRYTKEETYNKEEVEQMVTPPNPDYKYYATYADMVAETSHPAGAIYRVSSYDGTQVDATSYAEYIWNGSEYKLLAIKSQVNEVFDITIYNSNTKYADLAAALGTNGANVPSAIRKGGMSVKFVQSSDNKYVQYRLMSDTFNATPANWQGVDDVPTAESKNLVKSGGIYKKQLSKTEIPLIIETGKYYNISNTALINEIIKNDSNDSICTNIVVNKGIYIIVANNLSARKCIVQNSEITYLLPNASNGIVVNIDVDNTTLYLSSLNSTPISLYKVDNFDIKSENYLNINPLGIKRYNINYDVHAFLTISNNKVSIASHSNFCYKQLELPTGYYLFRTGMSRESFYTIIISDADNNVIQAYRRVNTFDKVVIFVPNNSCRVHVSSDRVIETYYYSLGILNNEYLINSCILTSELSSNTKQVTLTRGGYYSLGSRTLVENKSSYYTGEIDVEGYDEIRVVFPSIYDSGVRSCNIFDKNYKFIEGGREPGQNELIFYLKENAKYFYGSTVNSATTITLIKYDVKDKIKSIKKEVEPSDNPLTNYLASQPSFIRCFKKITCIGDSLTEGAFNITTSAGESSRVITEYSYPVMLNKITGVETVNLGRSSKEANRNGSSWYDLVVSQGLFDAEHIGDCVIIALGTNDIIRDGFSGDVSTDIDINDRNNNALTSVGGYANIIQAVREISPKTKIFCVTVSNTRNTEETRTVANTKIKDIAQLFGCYIIDLQLYAENNGVDQNMFTTFYKNGSHNNALGYFIRAKQYSHYIDWIIRNNLADFREIAFIGTDYHYYQ